jgi:hypothetical protein
MVQKHWVAPTPSKEYIRELFRQRKVEEEEEEDRELGDTRDDAQPSEMKDIFDKPSDSRPVSEKLSGDPVPLLAEVHNRGMYKEVVEIQRDCDARYGKKVVSEAINHPKKKKAKTDEPSSPKNKGSKGNAKGSDEWIPIDDINKLTVRLDPVIYVELETLLQVFRAGAITPTHFQKLMCQRSGVPDPLSYPGTKGAVRNAEFLWIMEGGNITKEIEDERSTEEAERADKTAKDATKNEESKLTMMHKFEMENIELSAKFGETAPTKPKKPKAKAAPKPAKPASETPKKKPKEKEKPKPKENTSMTEKAKEKQKKKKAK